MSNIDTSSWKEFKLCDLFSASNGDVDIQQKDINEKGTYVVTSGEQNNGILGKSDREARVFSADTLTVDMFGNVYYRDYEYKLVTHARVFSLKPLFVMNREIGLFMVSLLKFLTEIYSYTNMCSWSKIKDLSIKLPVTTVYEPDFDYMEKYVSELEQERVSELEQYLKVSGLDDYELTEEEIAFLQSTREVAV